MRRTRTLKQQGLDDAAAARQVAPRPGTNLRAPRAGALFRE
jgi:hypothetical protein